MIHPNRLRPLFSIGLLLSLCVAAPTASQADQWGTSKWIGLTQDDRPEQWSTRDATFNKPPAEIWKWKPTERELRALRRTAFPSPMLRTEFDVDKQVQSAEVIACGLGLYELHLNGSRVSDHVLDPAQTSYDKRAFFVRHDVSDRINQGKNAMGLWLGSGFFGQNIGFAPDLSYGPPRGRAVLEITCADGTRQRVESNDRWSATTSPILFDNLYRGETFDARRMPERWSEPGFDASRWQSAELMTAPTTDLQEQNIEPMRKVREVVPASLRSIDDHWIIDMGENMTGWLAIHVNQPTGTMLRVRFAEHLMPDGQTIDPATTGIHATGGEQEDIYICRGGGPELWEPRFTYHGFRYAQIEGWKGPLRAADITGWFVRTDMKRIGSFECSDPLIQKFYEVSMRTIEGNVQGNLTDCPHRERCAWMGDIHATAEATSFNFDAQGLWQKTSADMRSVRGAADPHKKDGVPKDDRVPCNIAVGKRLASQARPDWGAAIVLVPWYSYQHYGDTEIVRDAWQMMSDWIDYQDTSLVQDGIISIGYGDWCPPLGNGQPRAKVPLTSTALYFKSLRAMHQMALVLEKPEVAETYAAMAESIRQAFNQRFFDPETGGYGTQTGNVIAIDYGIVPDEKRQAVADRLAELVMEECDGHYTTGIFGHRALYKVLCDFGHADVVAHLWNKATSYPSLAYLTEEHGLTTWPEVPAEWNKANRYRRNSFNHPMHSGFAAAFHETLGGIRADHNGPGFKQFTLRPCFLPGLQWVNVSLESPQGLIHSRWKRQGDTVSWQATIPPGSTANVNLTAYGVQQIRVNDQPATANQFELGSGQHTIVVQEAAPDAK